MSQSPLHPAALDSARLLADCETRRLRRSGPGGQNRNKVETAVVLIHRPTGTVAEANERRSQAENLRAALQRLRVTLAVVVRHPVEASSAPSPLWKSRCRAGRIAINPDHDDFPTLLAEVLDVVEAHDMDVKEAASWFGCTPSQLTRLLKVEPRAILHVNAGRNRLGLHPLQ